MGYLRLAPAKPVDPTTPCKPPVYTNDNLTNAITYSSGLGNVATLSQNLFPVLDLSIDHSASIPLAGGNIYVAPGAGTTATTKASSNSGVLILIAIGALWLRKK